jgi:hypothetical protein
MQRTFLVSAALALSMIGTAYAQDASPGTAQSAPAAPDAASTPPAAAGAALADFKPGMVVKDSAGAKVGTIAQVGTTSDGTPAVALDVGGKQVVVAAATLKLASSGKEVVSSQTKAQIMGGG